MVAGKWWQRWPEWVAGAAAVWAVGYAGVNLALGGPAVVLWLTPVAVLVALAAVRPATGWLVPVAAGAVAALALVAGMFTVISVVVLVISGMVADWAGLLRQVLALVGAGLFAAAAESSRRRGRGCCGRCGRAPGEPVRPRSVPVAVRRTAYLGIAAFVPYVVMKALWAWGFRLGDSVPPDLVGAGRGLYGLLARYGLDATALAALAGMVLLLALVRPWGERVPRWLLLGPAWLGALLGPYGVVGLGWGAMVLLGWLPGSADAPVWVGLVGAVGFGGFGIASGVAAWSYQRRTRQLC
ncbi:hypothetical protein N8J89_20900 [Crossiella sp. CA-258035]|uniref:hypothetical protein n=1 Tax=Crossiella sp. CA-258035 TaxID=2981138 RepID=UPI0024BD1DBE|nr:hypothetical protein [Crossiella sp. CA-258035]WHT15608.1 hypothetical protein N8J89_20900 [Crossiella sp. CA-258035]